MGSAGSSMPFDPCRQVIGAADVQGSLVFYENVDTALRDLVLILLPISPDLTGSLDLVSQQPWHVLAASSNITAGSFVSLIFGLRNHFSW